MVRTVRRVIPPSPASFRYGPASPRLGRLLPILTALLLVLGASLAAADTLTPTTPTTPTTTATTPTTPTTPVIPQLTGAATAGQLMWSPPTALAEEQPARLTLSGTVNGFATLHTLLQPQSDGPCAPSPLYPRQIATGTPLSAVPQAAASGADATTPAPSGAVQITVTLTPPNAGPQRLCAWVVGSPSSSAASTVALLDQPYDVSSAPATLVQTAPTSTRAADFFTVQLSGTTAGNGRRALVMGEPDHGQDCATLTKLPAGKRALQTITSVGKGNFTKAVHLRFKLKTAPGSYLLCTQIVEASDRVPEAVQSQTIEVTDSGRCVIAKSAIAGRLQDAATVSRRRDAARARLAQIRAKLPKLQHLGAAARQRYEKRVGAAQRAVRHARSAPAKRRARRQLANVRRGQAALLRHKTAPLRIAKSAERQRAADYNQQRDGVTLLLDSVKRAQKTLKKYCG